MPNTETQNKAQPRTVNAQDLLPFKRSHGGGNDVCVEHYMTQDRGCQMAPVELWVKELNIPSIAHALRGTRHLVRDDRQTVGGRGQCC